MQRGLVNLHRMTAILPSVKILDGEIVKLDDIPVAGGKYSDIWLGRWLDEEKVRGGNFSRQISSSCHRHRLL